MYFGASYFLVLQMHYQTDIITLRGKQNAQRVNKLNSRDKKNPKTKL